MLRHAREDTRIKQRIIIAACALLAFAGGCGGDGTGPTTTSSSTLTVDEYLARILELELVSAAPQPTGRTTPNELAAYNYDVASRYQAAFDAIAAVTPPDEAGPHAAAYLSYAELGARTFRAAAEALLEGRATDETLQRRMAEINTTSEQLRLLFNELLTSALRDRGDPLSLYLVQSVALRDAFSDAYTTAVGGLSPLINSGDGAVIADALEASADTFDAHLADWQALVPPDAARETHARQIDLIAEVSAIFRDLVEPVTAEDEAATGVVAARMEVFIANVGATSEAWNRLLVAALRG